ncbi:MAG: helix-turn-helix transcriptional regulator [Desulforhopalus sp.]
MNSESNGRSGKKKYFKFTRDLVRLALNDGWTQDEIATKCRTQQSVVSGWKNGSKPATEQILKPLLDIYGYKLRRKTFRVYWSLDNEINQKTFYRVEGKVILAQAFYDPRRDSRGKQVKKIPVHKLVIHHQGEDFF